MKRIGIFLLLVCLFSACQPKEGAHRNPEVYSAENPFIHSVYFWFKDDVTDVQLKRFYIDTEKLKDIEVVKALYTGFPASTDRPIVERSYDFAVIVHFDGLEGHDTYQEHPIHLSLLEKHADLWERVMVTDMQ